MFISEFACGILVTIAIEFIALIIYAVVRKNKK